MSGCSAPCGPRVSAVRSWPWRLPRCWARSVSCGDTELAAPVPGPSGVWLVGLRVGSRQLTIPLVTVEIGVTALVDEGRDSDLIYLGLCKASDTVPHDIRGFQLERHGFDR